MRAVTVAASTDTTERNWVRAWPLGKPAWLKLAQLSVILFAATTAFGLFYMAVLDDGPIGDADRAVVEWLADRRTPTWNSMSEIGSMLSDTLVKVVLVAAVGGTMVAVWRRWHDGVFLALAVIVEASIFVVSSFIIGRDRPPVQLLDDPAPSGSLPSGHAAAAVAFYGGVFLIICWHTRRVGVRVVFGVIAIAAPLAVGLSRIQRGMHHPVDVAAGLALGIGALLVVRAAILRGVADLNTSGADLPPQVRRLDLTEEQLP
jgi:undecaprenyl-diphosphatase